MFNFKFLNKMTKNRFNLRKVATIVTCLAVTTMLVACDKTNGDDDDDNGNGRELTADEKKLVGFWADNPEDAIDRVLSVGRWIEFKSDGTFSLKYNVWWRSGSIRELATTIWQKGNFKVVDGKIRTSKVLETAQERLAGYGGTYSNRSVTLTDWEYVFTDNNAGAWKGYNWVVINLLNWDLEALHDWYFYVKRDDYK